MVADPVAGFIPQDIPTLPPNPNNADIITRSNFIGRGLILDPLPPLDESIPGSEYPDTNNTIIRNYYISPSNTRLEISNSVTANDEIALDSPTVFSGTILPSLSIYSLGSAGKPWSTIHGTLVGTSDFRLKTDIQDCDLGLDFITHLKPKKYKIYNKPDRIRYGLIAQDVEKLVIDKESIYTKEKCFATETKDGEYIDEIYGMNYTELIAPMIKAIQELSDKVTKLEESLSHYE